jgi:hypothetical protein
MAVSTNCDETEPQWPLWTLGQCAGHSTAWLSDQTGFISSHTTLLYQCSWHISRSHPISRSTDLYLQIYRSVERVCCLLVLDTVTSTPVDSMDNATLAGQNRAVSGSLRMHPGQTIPAPCRPAAQQLSSHQQSPLQHTHEWSLGQLVMMMSFICSCSNNK